jgi:allophanate hydrolase subunit 2
MRLFRSWFDWNFNGDVFRRFAPRTEQHKLGEMISSSDQRIRRLAAYMSSHLGRFITTGGEPLKSDDAFRAAQYLEAQKQDKKDVAANKAEKYLYKYQEAAKGVLAMEKEAKDLSKKDWEAWMPSSRTGMRLSRQS